MEWHLHYFTRWESLELRMPWLVCGRWEGKGKHSNRGDNEGKIYCWENSGYHRGGRQRMRSRWGYGDGNSYVWEIDVNHSLYLLKFEWVELPIPLWNTRFGISELLRHQNQNIDCDIFSFLLAVLVWCRNDINISKKIRITWEW